MLNSFWLPAGGAGGTTVASGKWQVASDLPPVVPMEAILGQGRGDLARLFAVRGVTIVLSN
jgi:hypothetical protein